MRIRIQIKNIVKTFPYEEKKKKDCSKVKPIELVQIYFTFFLNKITITVTDTYLNISNFLEFFCYF